MGVTPISHPACAMHPRRSPRLPPSCRQVGPVGPDSHAAAGPRRSDADTGCAACSVPRMGHTAERAHKGAAHHMRSTVNSVRHTDPHAVGLTHGRVAGAGTCSSGFGHVHLWRVFFW